MPAISRNSFLLRRDDLILMSESWALWMHHWIVTELNIVIRLGSKAVLVWILRKLGPAFSCVLCRMRICQPGEGAGFEESTIQNLDDTEEFRGNVALWFF